MPRRVEEDEANMKEKKKAAEAQTEARRITRMTRSTIEKRRG